MTYAVALALAAASLHAFAQADPAMPCRSNDPKCAARAIVQRVDVYEQLERTDFPTLYAATRPGDDFAESFVSYVHTVLLKRPLEIRLYRDGRLAKTYRSCWEEERCARKRRLLEDLLKS